MNEIKFGRMHYVLDDRSGFWCARHQTDPQSATVTIGELVSLVNDYHENMKALIEKANKNQGELKAFLEYHS